MEGRRGAIESVLRIVNPDFIEWNVVRIYRSVAAIDKVNIKLVTNVFTIDKID